MKSFARLFLAAAFALAAPAFAQTVDHQQHSFSNAERWARSFDDPTRDEWQKPHQVIQSLGLQPSASIADIGAGTGYFASRFARMVPNGRVYGVDAEPDMVRYLAQRAKREELANLTAVAARPDDPGIPAAVDLAILVNTYHHIDARERYFRNLQRSLKPGGRLAIIDFKLDSPYGPPRSARVSPEQVKQELASAGYKLAQEHAFLPYQYFLIFQPIVK